jgi:hypothetical protein
VVNASLNWASIVGIVLAVGGAFLYFMRSFKPALARDYDVFFAAIGLLCGGILFFQGWRLDPILQFGQFLLAGTTVFFAYESVRLRGVTTEQARRSSYFDDDEPAPFRPRSGLGGAPAWDNDVDRFDEPPLPRRRIPVRDEPEEEDFYRPRRPSRAAIPERAVSRRPPSEDWESPRRSPRSAPTAGPPDRDADSGFGRESAPPPNRYTSSRARDRSASEFGSRRRERDSDSEPRRGSRPVPSSDAIPRSSRRPQATAGPSQPSPSNSDMAAGVPQGTPIRPSSRGPVNSVSDADFAPMDPRKSPSTTAPSSPPSSHAKHRLQGRA